jgi:hypothetical protein
MDNLNGHETGNGGYSQGHTYGNLPFLDPTVKNYNSLPPFLIILK